MDKVELRARTLVIDIAASTLLDMLLRRKGTAAMATGHQPGIGKRVLLLSGLIPTASFNPLSCHSCARGCGHLSILAHL